MQNVTDLKQEVIDRELCMKCGTCIGVCPTGAIMYANSEIRIDDQKCIQCGKCCKACPGKEFPMDEWSQRLFNRRYDVNEALGSYQSIWTARAKSNQVYQKSASGGVVTQLCLDLLESQMAEGVVAVWAKQGVPYEFEPFIAQTPEEVIKAAQSKYVLMPVNGIIKEIKQTNRKVIFVGLPCQIQGMRKAMELDGQLQKQVRVLISLFCGFNMEKAATDYLISKSRIKKEEISELSYRHKRGGQTGFYIRGKEEKELFVDKHGYTFMNLIYSNKRCWKCFDYSGEFADLSVGDAWDHKGGGSRVIIRTDTGNQIWEHSMELGSVQAEPAKIESILKTQKMIVRYKKENIGIRKKFMKSFPEYGVEMPVAKGKGKTEGYLLYFIMQFFKTGVGRTVRKCLPFQTMIRISEGMKRKEID